MERHLEQRPAEPRDEPEADEIIEIFDAEPSAAPPFPDTSPFDGPAVEPGSVGAWAPHAAGDDQVEVFDAPGEEPAVEWTPEMVGEPVAPSDAPVLPAAAIPPAAEAPIKATAIPLPAPAAPEVPEAAPVAVPLPAPAFAADVSTDGEDVLSLFVPAPEPAAPEPAAGRADDAVDGARDLFALGDFTGALELLGGALARDPHHAEARELFARTEETLVQMYESKLGRLSQTPRVRLQPDEIVWLNLDHRAGFVLAQIDGQVSLEDIFALSGMSRLDTAKILVELLEQGAIAS